MKERKRVHARTHARTLRDGDSEDANVYACFAVSESAALGALLGEPRMLGMTPDTALVDLNAEETTPALASMLRREAAAWWRGAASSLGGGVRAVDGDRAALLTVVWRWFKLSACLIHELVKGVRFQIVKGANLQLVSNISFVQMVSTRTTTPWWRTRRREGRWRRSRRT